MERRAWFFAWAITVFFSGSAMAEGPKDDARELFDKGRALFRDNRFDAAAAEFKAAFDLEPDPAYVYNIALCYEQKGRWRLAVEYYDRFLKLVPDSPARAEVDGRRRAAEQARASEAGVVAVITPSLVARVVVTHVGGVVRCESPCTATVDPGPVSVEVSSEFRLERRSQAIEPNGRWDLAITFPEPGELLIESPDPDVQVKIAGRLVPVGVPIALSVGHYVVEAVGPRMPVQRVPVDIRARGLTSITLAGEPMTSAAFEVAGWTTLGVGAAALVSGIVLAVMAQNAYDEGLAVLERPYSQEDATMLEGLRTDVSRRSLGADISFGIAAAGIVSGVTLLVLDAQTQGQAPDKVGAR